ncbi:MAG: hypothetical protein ACSHXW_07865 [Yoonia sp.]
MGFNPPAQKVTNPHLTELNISNLITPTVDAGRAWPDVAESMAQWPVEQCDGDYERLNYVRA